jgi:hypothetical protein
MASRDEGFAVMDVSTSICDDPKFRRLAREHPEHIASGFVAYVATMAESWRTGRRVRVEDAWPSVLPFVPESAGALRDVGLLDRAGKVPMKTWAGWFDPAARRRESSRERWRRYNAQRDKHPPPDADTTDIPRGSDVDTATSVPPVPSGPTGPSAPPDRDARANGAKPESVQEHATTKRGGPITSVKDELLKHGYVPLVKEASR